MSSSSTKQSNSLYPEVILTNPEAFSYSSTSSSMYPTTDSSHQSKSVYPEHGFASSMYPTVDMKDTAEKLFPDEADPPIVYHQPYEKVLVTVKGAIVNLIEREKSVELASGDLSIVSLYQGDNVVAVFARIGDEIQWPLAKDEVTVKLDESHYFFTLRVPDTESTRRGEYEVLNYGVTVAAKGQESVLKEFDSVLETYGCFSVQEVRVSENWEAVPKEISPEEMEESKEKRDLMGRSSVAYWTTLAPNVEDYSGTAAKLIAAGSGQLIRGILWCGDVTVDRLKWSDQFLRKRMGDKSVSEISPDTMKRIKRVKKLTKKSEQVATGILSGVVKVSGFFTSSIVNSKAGKKFFSLLPGEIVLASLDGFNKICDAVEVSGKNVMSTSSVVTTGLVSERYGEQAGKATSEGLGAAGHAIGTAWAVFKIRKALNPKSVIKPTTLVKAAASNSGKKKDKKKDKKDKKDKF